MLKTEKGMGQVGIIIGSESDREVMYECVLELERLQVTMISPEITVASAHRDPDMVDEFIRKTKEQGVKIIIAAAGMSAALPGVVAAKTKLPVIGVPMKSDLMGIDSLLSISQMPKGVPVATMSIGKHGAINAALFAKRCLSIWNNDRGGAGGQSTDYDRYISENLPKQ